MDEWINWRMNIKVKARENKGGNIRKNRFEVRFMKNKWQNYIQLDR